MAKQKKKKSKKISIKYIVAIAAVIFIATGFLFGGKAQGVVYGKLMAKGNFFFNGGAYDLDKAAKYYKAASFVDGKSSFSRYQLARIFFLKTDYKNGLSEIDTALRINPENKRAYYIRGLIDGYAKNYPEAISDFQKFIAWSPKEWAGYNDLAWAYYENGDYENAKATAERGLAVAPDNVWLLNGLGVSLSGLGKFDEARETFEKTAKLAEGLTLGDWGKAYPGNDPASAEWDLAKFRADVKSNSSLAMSDISSGGVFAAACSSSTGNYCAVPEFFPHRGDDPKKCVSRTCDPDHEACVECASDCDCGASEVWPAPPTCTVNPADCKYNICGGCKTPRCDPAWIGLLGPCDKCCVSQTGSCGNSRCLKLKLDPCSIPVNNPPTVSITNPLNDDPNQELGQTYSFSATASDPDAGDTLTYTSVITCNSATMNNVPQNLLSFTYGPMPYGADCSWMITANDGKGGTGSDMHHFKIIPNPPIPCACGGLTSFCIGRTISDSDLCSQGSPSPLAGDIDRSVYEASWTCSGGGCSGTVSCTAQGQKSCGWIETNP